MAGVEGTRGGGALASSHRAEVFLNGSKAEAEGGRGRRGPW